MSLKTDTNEALLAAVGLVGEVIREIAEEIMRDDIERAGRIMWQGLPDEIKQLYKETYPERYAKIPKGTV